MKTYTYINSYIKEFPQDVQMLLKQMLAVIKKAAPKTEEAIRYGIPTLRYNNKNLVHFGGFKGHVSFFPGASGIAAFKKELGKYEVSKGTVQFPLDKKIPITLITKIVKFRLKEISESIKS